MGLQFVPAGSYPAAAGAGNLYVLLEDLNGDGKRDLVVTNYIGRFLSIQLGAGDGTFVEVHRHHYNGSMNEAPAVADMNGDGKKDLVFSMNVKDAGLHVLPGKGDGTFLAPLIHALPNPTGMTLADFDKDGDRDAVVVLSSGTVSLLANDGDGTFTKGPNSSLPDSHFLELATADMDGDGWIDLVAADRYTANVYVYKAGAGGLAAPKAIPAIEADSIDVADLSGDGKPDLVLGAREGEALGLVTLINEGNGAFTSKAHLAGSSASVELVADVDGNGKSDVICADSLDGHAFFLPNTGAGDLGAPVVFDAGKEPSGFAAGDLDGDGDVDLVVGNAGPGLSILHNTGAGQFLGEGVPFGQGAMTIVTGDFNGDGMLDATFGSVAPILTHVRSKPGGGLEVAGANDLADPAQRLFPVQLDADQKLDMVAITSCAAGACNTLQTLQGAGDGTFQPAVTALELFGANDADIGDVDGDGDIDIAITYGSNDGSVLTRANGDGTFMEEELSPAPDALALADMDGDGVLDLVASADFAYVQRGKGDGTFLPAASYLPVGDVVRRVVVGDVNGDGHKDFLTTAGHSDLLTLYLGSESLASFTPSELTLNTGSAPSSPVLADIDGDQDADLAVIAGGRVYVLLAEGSSFAPGAVITSIASPSSLAVADMNADGRPDLLVTSSSKNTLEILLNTP